MKNIRIRVPASSGNLGPGFDTLGLAVNLYKDFELSLEGERIQIQLREGMDPALEPLCLNMVRAVADLFFSAPDWNRCHFS